MSEQPNGPGICPQCRMLAHKWEHATPTTTGEDALREALSRDNPKSRWHEEQVTPQHRSSWACVPLSDAVYAYEAAARPRGVEAQPYGDPLLNDLYEQVEALPPHGTMADAIDRQDVLSLLMLAARPRGVEDGPDLALQAAYDEGWTKAEAHYRERESAGTLDVERLKEAMKRARQAVAWTPEAKDIAAEYARLSTDTELGEGEG